MARIQAVRGMSDLLPAQSRHWRFLEDCARELFTCYGLEEIRTPIVEPTELFCRSIGEVTDIVEKEMYTFADRNGDSLTLRPEGTAAVVRACEQAGLLYNQTQRLWYAGPMFRHERPQKGRYRQFHQIGVECFGFPGPDIDTELLALTHRLWQRLGLAEHVTLEINTLGTPESRHAYREAFVEWLRPQADALDEDSRRRLEHNPLRILDSKHPGTRALLAGAPAMSDFLDASSHAHFATLCRGLDRLGIAYRVNQALVRGLDYYSRTVFEWTTESLGAQGTVCAGGRYDGLVAQLGGKPTPGVGFAMGVERLILLMEAAGSLPAPQAPVFFVIALGEPASLEALQLAEQLRQLRPDLRLILQHGEGSLKKQLKKADVSGARFALILGEQEVATAQVQVKPLRGDGESRVMAQSLFLAQLGQDESMNFAEEQTGE